MSNVQQAATQLKTSEDAVGGNVPGLNMAGHNMEQLYDDWAAQYASFFYENPQEGVDETKYSFGQLLKNRLPEGAKVLEIGCGVGLCVRGLAELGFEVTGTDISAASLQVAEGFVAEGGQNATLIKHDILEGGLKPEYDAVVAVGSLITHFTSEQDQRTTIRHMMEALKPGGLLLIGLYDFEILLKDEPYDFISSFGVFKDRPAGTTVCMQRRRWHGSPRERVHKSTFYGVTSDKKMRTLTMDARAITHRELSAIIVETGAAKIEWMEPSVSHYYQPLCLAIK